jgi:hypothetical protein
VPVRGYRLPGGMCLLDQQPQLLDRELWGEHVGARVTMPPLAITLTTSTCRFIRSRTTPTISSAPLTSPPTAWSVNSALERVRHRPEPVRWVS